MNRTRAGNRRLAAISLVGALIVFFYYWNVRSTSDIQSAAFLSDNRIFVTDDAQVPRLKIIGLDPLNRNNVSLAQKGASNKCQIPKLEMNSPEVSKFFQKTKPLDCQGEPLWLDVDLENRLVLTDHAKETGITIDNLKCSVHFYDRVNDNTLNWTSSHNFEVGKPVELSENFLVNCTHKQKSWKHLYMNLVARQKFIEKAQKTEHNNDWSGLNVLFLGFDSLSQQAFRRNLPVTVDYLEKEMGSVVLNGYNIVGDGTPQAFIPILTAKTEEELPLTRKRYPNAKFVDVYPWIWRNFSDAGYVTLYGEDAAAIGTFTYRLKGFKQQPTDHYTRTFFQFAEKYEKNWKCSGPVPQHKVWFKYADKFMRKYPSDVPKFGLMHHSMLSHDSANEVQNADTDLKDLLKGLNDDGMFEKTVVIVMADHGHRFSELRATQQGQLEERLPFFSIYLPTEFRQTERGALMYKNLKTNAERLSTPFDVHETLMNILKMPSVEELSKVQSAGKRSLSLFKEIPESRSCEQAGILPHWCTCLAWQSAYEEEKDKQTSNMLAHAVVQAINSYTSSERKLCSPLRFAEMLDSKWLVPDASLLHYSGVKDTDGFVPDLKGNLSATFGTFQIRFKTTPGNALYDSTVYYDSISNEVTIDFKSISHINKFGSTPHCIIDKNYFMASYCVCYDKI